MQFVSCCVKFATNRQLPKLSLPATIMLGKFLNFHHSFEYACGAYEALSAIILGGSLEERSHAVSYLMNHLIEKGHEYSSSQWETILVLLTKILHRNIPTDNADDEIEWLSTTFVEFLRLFVEMFAKFYTMLYSKLGEIFNSLTECVLLENESIGIIGLECMRQIILANSDHFKEGEWRVICESVEIMLHDSRPNEILNFDFSELKESTDKKAVKAAKCKIGKIAQKCSLQFIIIQFTSDIFSEALLEQFSTPERISNSLRESYSLAKSFNLNSEHRLNFIQTGIMKHIPNLMKQEVSAGVAYLKIAEFIFSKNGRGDYVEACDEIISAFCDSESLKDLHRTSWMPCIPDIVYSLLKLTDSQIEPIRESVYSSMVNVIGPNLSDEMYKCVKTFFMRMK